MTNFGEQIYGCTGSKRIGERDTKREENKCAVGAKRRRDATRSGKEALKRKKNKECT